MPPPTLNPVSFESFLTFTDQLIKWCHTLSGKIKKRLSVSPVIFHMGYGMPSQQNDYDWWDEQSSPFPSLSISHLSIRIIQHNRRVTHHNSIIPCWASENLVMRVDSSNILLLYTTMSSLCIMHYSPVYSHVVGLLEL